LLNGNNTAAELIGEECTVKTVPEGTASRCLEVPTAYVLLGGALVASLIVFGLVLLAVLLRTAWSRDIGVDRDLEPIATQSSTPSEPLLRGRRDARRWAGRAHRAEKLIGLLVYLGLSVVLLMLAFSAAGEISAVDEEGADWWEEVIQWTVSRGALAFAFVGLLLLAAAIGGGRNQQRPLGLVWDLVSFLPRAAHPFAPPCYAERAVPEIVGRCGWWLKPVDAATLEGRRGTRIVLSAHSLGSVLAVAAVFTMTERPDDAKGNERFRLLSYGSQLRAYFGRIFPEMLGPQILGTTPVTGARLWADDPWRDEVNVEPDALDPDLDSVVNRLRDLSDKTPRWLNLWRRTDYLGFPVHAYWPNDVDVRASELDETGYQIVIGTHSDYQNTKEYSEALARLS
jgi:hypothetical protein